MRNRHTILKVLTAAALCTVTLVGLGIGFAQRPPASVSAGTEAFQRGAAVGPDSGILGLVQDGRLVRVGRGDCSPMSPARLTTIQPQAAMSPEAAEIPLAAYEGRAIMVAGIDQGERVYSAEVVEVAGPILSAVTQHVFDRPARLAQREPPITADVACASQR